MTACGTGVEFTFTNSRGLSKSTYFCNPPESIDHVCKGYLNNRLNNVVRKDQVEFIKARYKEEIKKFR